MTMPYKCPCCNGYGVRRARRPTTYMDAIVDHDEPCRPCAGTGIVWAPTPSPEGSTEASQ